MSVSTVICVYYEPVTVAQHEKVEHIATIEWGPDMHVAMYHGQLREIVTQGAALLGLSVVDADALAALQEHAGL